MRVHQMRAEEDAIMVGTNTAEKDNPSLKVRHCEGKNPLRIVLDKNLRLPSELNLFDNSTKTLVFNSIKNELNANTEFIQMDFSEDLLEQILYTLHQKNVLSLIVEGGKQLLETFISANQWDEAHVYTGNKHFKNGITAPILAGKTNFTEKIQQDSLNIFRNKF